MSSDGLFLLQAVRFLAAFLFICCLPGLALSCLLFPTPRLDSLERFYIASTASVALSSLLAGALLLLQDQIHPANFAVGILILAAIFHIAAYWRARRAGHKIDPLSPPLPAIRRRSGKPLWLVAGLILFSLFFLLAVNISGDPDPGEDLSASVPSTITEFYISPQKVEHVLGSFNNPRGELEIPLEIVNHNPELVAYRLEINNADQKIYYQAGITVPAGKSWERNVIIQLPDSIHSPYLDLNLFTESAPDPVAQLRIWY